MRFTTILSVAALAGVSFAQTTASVGTNGSGGPGSGCPAKDILTTCLGTENSRLSSCAPLDYTCMCQIQADVLTCYNNCPNDINRSTEESKLTAWCVAASATMSTPASTFSVVSTSASPNGATPTGGSSSPTDEATNPSNSGSGSSPASKTSSGPASTSTADTPNSGAKITWMCASSLMAVLTAAFMAL